MFVPWKQCCAMWCLLLPYIMQPFVWGSVMVLAGSIDWNTSINIVLNFVKALVRTVLNGNCANTCSDCTLIS